MHMVFIAIFPLHGSDDKMPVMGRIDFCRKVFKLNRLFGIQSILIESEYLPKRYYFK